MPDACTTTNRPFLLGVKSSENKVVVIRPDCNSWNCPYCAERKKAEWFLHAYSGSSALLEQEKTIAMLTLTARGGAGRTVTASLRQFKRSWPKLRKRIRYAEGYFSYIAMPEHHESGLMHLHVICNFRQSEHWLHDNAFESGLGYQAKKTPITDASQTAAYVTKYIAKSLERSDWPRNFRRVRTSRNWKKATMPEPIAERWEPFFDFGKLMWEVHYWRDRGYEADIRCSTD